jgi:hypothetical protein
MAEEVRAARRAAAWPMNKVDEESKREKSRTKREN